MGDFSQFSLALVCSFIMLLLFQVDDWPYVRFFSKRDNNLWCLDDLKFTIAKQDIICQLEAPELLMMESRVYYKFKVKYGSLVFCF